MLLKTPIALDPIYAHLMMYDCLIMDISIRLTHHVRVVLYQGGGDAYGGYVEDICAGKVPCSAVRSGRQRVV